MIPIMFSVMCSVAQLGPTLWTLWTIARQAPLSMDSSRQESQSGLPFPSPGDLPNPEIKPVALVSPALAGRSFTTEPPGKPLSHYMFNFLFIYFLTFYFYFILLYNTVLVLPYKF